MRFGTLVQNPNEALDAAKEIEGQAKGLINYLGAVRDLKEAIAGAEASAVRINDEDGLEAVRIPLSIWSELLLCRDEM